MFKKTLQFLSLIALLAMLWAGPGIAVSSADPLERTLCTSCSGTGRCYSCGATGFYGSQACYLCSGTARCYYCDGDGEW